MEKGLGSKPLAGAGWVAYKGRKKKKKKKRRRAPKGRKRSRRGWQRE